MSKWPDLDDVFPDGNAGLEAEPGHIGGSVVSGQCGQVDAGDGSAQPSGLPLLLDGASGP